MDLLDKTLAKIESQDKEWRVRAKERLDNLCMPHWALGRLMDLAVDLAGMTRSMKPPVQQKSIITMAGDHGVVEEGVSKFPQEVTPQMVYNFVRGGAGINALARQAGARVIVVDMGVAADLSDLAESGKIIDKKVAPGTLNMAAGPAMTRQQAIASIEAGIEVAESLGRDT
ncbi:MAG: nicotinate-nucleotide--dimethylbenzimidazole phosphoribosyltransferase, partial [Desulfobulbaceae bacterium]|nr:nicotinate-nucleotide--dimethylbenzimidazole phosphoribosyltransferase [Desulfobulbaceae bacterium]